MAATVTMTVLEQNDAPVIDLIADRAVHEGTQVSFDVTASDENTGDSLRYTLDSAPTGAWINFWTGRFNWTAADGPGTAVTVRVTDTGNPALSDIDTFTITVDNVAPILTLSGNATVEADAPFQLTLDASDPGSDTITEWEITWGDGAVETLAGNPTSAMHTYDVVGTYEITATATDEDGTFTSNTFTLAVTGDVPIATVLVNGGGTQRTRVSSFEVQFSADVGDAIDDSDLQIRNLTTATNLLPGDWSSSYDPVTHTLNITFEGLPDGLLPAGNWEITIFAAGVVSSQGVPMESDHLFGFHVLSGDVNEDRVVNDWDLLLVWQNLSGDPAFDLTGDGVVDEADLDLVRANYLATLPLPAPPVPALAPLADSGPEAADVPDPESVATTSPVDAVAQPKARKDGPALAGPGHSAGETDLALTGGWVRPPAVTEWERDDWWDGFWNVSLSYDLHQNEEEENRPGSGIDPPVGGGSDLGGLLQLYETSSPEDL